MGGAFSAALMPVAAEIVPHMRKEFAALTEIIKENKDNIKFLGDVMALPVRVLHEMTDAVISLSKAIDDAKGEGATLGQVFDAMAEKRDDFGALMNVAPSMALSALFSPLPVDAYLALYSDEIEKFKAERAKLEEEAKAKNDERLAQFANAPNLSALSEAERQKLMSTVETMDKERVQREQETADILYKINHSSYESRLRDLENFKTEQLRIIEETESQLQESLGQAVTLEEERAALDDNVEAKRIQIEQERRDNVAELSENITAIYRTELENRLAQIEKERQAWIDKCGDEVEATKLAEQQKVDAQREAAMNVVRQQGEEYTAYLQGGFEGLMNYKLMQLAKSGVNMNYLNMTPEDLAAFQKAQQVANRSMMPNFMTDMDREMYRQQMTGNWQRPDTGGYSRQPADEENYAIVDGVKTGMSEALGSEQPISVRVENGNELEVKPNSTQPEMTNAPPQNTPSAYSPEEGGTYDPSQILGDVASSFGSLPEAAQGLMESFDELSATVQNVTEILSAFELPEFDEAGNPFEVLESAAKTAAEKFSDMATGVDEVTNMSSQNLEPEIQTAAENFSAIGGRVDEVTVKLSDLAAAIANLKIPDMTSQANQRTPVEVNTTVQIEEAHAWDSQHIQELAERVADKLEPSIMRAIGGDDNSY